MLFFAPSHLQCNAYSECEDDCWKCIYVYRLSKRFV